MAPDDLRQTGPFIGIGGVVVVAFLYAYVAIAFPDVLHSVVMPLLWLAVFVLACRWFTRRPRAVMVLPVVAALLWFALLLTFG
jgi:hypothetical protein